MTGTIHKYDNCTTLDELLDVEYGKKGTPTREIFDAETREFCKAQNATVLQ